MSFTVVNDNGVIQVRASIETRTEMEALAKALSNAEQHLPPTSAAEAETRLDEHTLTHKVIQ